MLRTMRITPGAALRSALVGATRYACDTARSTPSTTSSAAPHAATAPYNSVSTRNTAARTSGS